MKQELNEKKNTLLNNYQELETEVEKQEDIISSKKNKFVSKICVFLEKQEKIIIEFKSFKQDDERKVLQLKVFFVYFPSITFPKLRMN